MVATIQILYQSVIWSGRNKVKLFQRNFFFLHLSQYAKSLAWS